MRNFQKLIVVASLVSGAQMALAEGLYVVGSIGAGIPASSVKSDIDSVLTALGATNFSSSMSNGTAMSGALGYTINESLAVEVGYLNSGTMSYTAPLAGGTLGADIKVTATQIALIGRAPVNDKFSVYGKVGYSMATTTGSVTATAGGISASAPIPSSDKNSTGIGFGASYKVSDQISLRAGYELYAKDLSGVMVGVQIKF